MSRSLESGQAQTSLEYEFDILEYQMRCRRPTRRSRGVRAPVSDAGVGSGRRCQARSGGVQGGGLGVAGRLVAGDSSQI
jgi:hypothetical protein